MDEDYIKVADGEDAEFMEFPIEDNGSMTLSTVQGQFPQAIGLKYKGPSGAWRAIRAVDNVLNPPKGGWGERTYCIAASEASKRIDTSSTFTVDRSKVSYASVNPLLKDLAVIRLPFSTTQEEMREYFESSFGKLSSCELIHDRQTGKSRGFGFVSFSDEEVAREALAADHYKLGRLVELRQKKDKSMKIFVGRLPHHIKVAELSQYFSQFGHVEDAFIPTPFRHFAFITMGSLDAGNEVLRQIHVLDGVRLNVEERKTDTKHLDKGPIPVNSVNVPDQNGNNNSAYAPAEQNENNEGVANGGYTYNTANGTYPSNAAANIQQAMQNDGLALDLKNMLFEFLSTQK